jgi:hypothetical protein
MAARVHPVQVVLRRSLTILVALTGIGAVLWPSYRKFLVNEWQERIRAGKPVVFVPSCPNISDQLKCNDRYTIVFRKGQPGQLCAYIRKNEEPERDPVCGTEADQTGYWGNFRLDGVPMYYSWRGRVVMHAVGGVGWLDTPEAVLAQASHPLSIE